MIRVLLVDDEQAALDDLVGGLRAHRSEWSLQFTTNPFGVLPLLEKRPADVIVADMRMPGMNGLRLLQVIKARFPDTVRVIVADRFDLRESVDPIGAAHQYLPKPCNPTLLADVVTRALSLRTTLRSDELTQMVTGLSNLPSIPALYARLVHLARSPDSSISDLAAVVAEDAAMTTRVIQLVNSALFGLRKTVTDARQAVSLLGLDNIVALALGSHVFTEMKNAAAGGLDMQREHDRTMDVAAGAAAIALESGLDGDEASTFYLAGMLHDVGRLILASHHPGRYRAAVPPSTPPRDIPGLERTEFGVSHELVGAYLLGLWGIPDTVVEAAAHHHTPSESPVRRLDPLAGVHVAQAVADAGDADPGIDMAYLAESGLAAEAGTWVEVAAAAMTFEDQEAEDESVA